MLQIRPFLAPDYERITAVWNAAWPDYSKLVSEFKAQDELRNPQHYWQRLVVEEAGEIIGYGQFGEAWWSKVAGQYGINFITHPDFLGHGAATAFYKEMLVRLGTRGDLQYLVTETREDYAQAIQFLTERGFTQVMRYPTSHLDLTVFDPDPYQHKLAHVAQAGIDICPLATLQERDADWMTRFHRLKADVIKDVPSPDEMVEWPFEELQRSLAHPNFMPEGVFVAVDKGQYVALSELWSSQADLKKLFTGLTGVLRSHRRRGLATAVKVRAICFAQRYGATILETDNEENNPMFQLNLQLGFQPQPALIEFKKKM
jgi:GNAT superfamily N-acetyltransferase